MTRRLIIVCDPNCQRSDQITDQITDQVIRQGPRINFQVTSDPTTWLTTISESFCELFTCSTNGDQQQFCSGSDPNIFRVFLLNIFIL